MIKSRIIKHKVLSGSEINHKKRATNSSSLLKDYITILVGVCAVILFSFMTTYFIINNWYMKESIQTARNVFDQAADNVTKAESDIGNLYSSVTSAEAVLTYLHADTLGERSVRLKDYYQLVGSLMKINENVAAMMLYNQNEELVVTKGTIFFPKQDTVHMNGMFGFSGRISDQETGDSYFQVEMPVYQKEDVGSFKQLGTAVLLFNTLKLQGIVDGVSAGSETYTAILDRQNRPVVSAGLWEEGYDELVREEQIGREYLYFQTELTKSGWRLVQIVPKSSFMSYMNQVQAVNLITYLIVAAALVVVCVTIYRKVIQPIRRQMEFVVGYTKDTNQRIEVVERNEFGELAQKINQMLDGIEELNSRVLEGERRYLELEYAKKQTEMVAYKSQINPHFMYNTLECIRGMALYHKEKEIARLAGSLSKLFRYNVKGDEIVTVTEAIRNLKEYAMIIDYRFMGKFEVCLESTVSLAQVRLPKMLIQPLVENAVLHGLEPKMEKGRVMVNLKESGPQEMEIIVEDDGCGMDPAVISHLTQQMEAYVTGQATWPDQGGIGITNVYRRVRLFYGERARFMIDSEEGTGTRITMVLPKEL